jgi:SAM-dependent methyltransferase
LLEHCRYEAADFEKVDKPYAKSTYVCDLSKNIPVEDGRFDAILFNQVMEHIPEPLTALKELRRVLKPGGRMLCTAPLFYEEHEQPYDFYRYTQFAWRKLMAEADLEVLRLDWMEGYFGTVAYQLQTAAHYLPSRPTEGFQGALPLVLSPLMFLLRAQFNIVARLFYRLDERELYKATGYPKNYLVIVRKNS